MKPFAKSKLVEKREALVELSFELFLVEEEIKTNYIFITEAECQLNDKAYRKYFIIGSPLTLYIP